MHTQEPLSKKQIFKFILQALRPSLGFICLAIGASLLLAVEVSLSPYLTKVLLNRVANSPGIQNLAYLGAPAILLVLATFLTAVIRQVYIYCFDICLLPTLRSTITNNVMEHLLHHSQNYYQNQFPGSLTNKINNLTSSIPNLLERSIESLFINTCALIIAVGTLWWVNIQFALIIFFWAILWIGFASTYSRKLRALSASWSEAMAKVSGYLVDILSNILSVRLFSRQTQELNAFKKIVDTSTIINKAIEWRYFQALSFHSISVVVVQGLTLYLLLKGRQMETITLGDFALVLGINTSIVLSFWRLANDFSQFAKHVGRITQALQSILIPIEIQDAPDAQPLKVHQGSITFDHVSFRYTGHSEAQANFFDNQSIVIPAGQKVGLVGYSGGGKSTFVNLILRLFDISSGHILIDGQDIQSVTQASLRQAISMIPQEPLLFHRSLMENIRYGAIGASDAAVIEAAKQAHAHDFILQQSEGYKALVGERGVKLSGGQRQRIAIARAILKNAPILILDEATSQLDSVTEQHIQDSLWNLMQGKTTLIIAHRLSTLSKMNRILVFEGGHIVQDGTHAGLLSQEGLYADLWKVQVGGFLPSK